ncbi:MAG: methylenetetrahydrofolate--tRNA-(uracil(54)-C(5))-methyltransferase (FADH(2)-oxidizing) TrmFO [Ruminococcaceae bacterium]|nr:methylenetetrahydrofolate--tRNA-(uracil(54)-C(5))-methyltransferase (FADH(2)-oxidizing) TrmFO [Oscillospiraceae bacterium]
MQNKAIVIGGGLAGCEAAWQLAAHKIPVDLYEMKPVKYTPAHSYQGFAELVCSNSLRSDQLENAVGLLKAELRELGSLIMTCADATRVEAGGALAVDREKFSDLVTEKIRNHPYITVHSEEIKTIPEGRVIVATGPLTADALADDIAGRIGGGYLHFYDASAPIVSADSIDMEHAFLASRYDRGTPDYINCPMEKEEYDAFVEALITAEGAEVHGFEDSRVFEGCMPIEVMARRGHETIAYGPMKPVGLIDPHTGKEAYATVQLRRDNAEGTAYNIVGFQTHLRHGEQKRVFSMIPGLAHAEFLRYGVMHRNTFISSPGVLGESYELLSDPRIRFAGQMTGVEGYVESTSSGYVAGLSLAREMLGLPPVVFGTQTAIGALAYYISHGGETEFQPMNVNFGIIASYEQRIRKKRDRYRAIAERALARIAEYRAEILRGQEGVTE